MDATDQAAAWCEVGEDHFAGALALPLFNGPQPGFEHDFPGSEDLPAGKRTDWRDTGTFCGPVRAIRIVTPIGIRRFIATNMPIRTHAEAMRQLKESIRETCRDVAENVRRNYEAEAEKLGITAEQLHAKRYWEARQERHHQAAHDHEDERLAIECGSWLRSKMEPGQRAKLMAEAYRQKKGEE